MDTRNALLQAARSIIKEDGFPAVSAREVGRRAGLSAMAMYRHFADKNDLLDEVAELGFETLLKYLEDIDESAPADERIVRRVVRFAEFAADHPNMFALMFIRKRGNVRRFPIDFANGASATFDIVRADVSDAMASGAWRCDDEIEVTLTLWATCQGLITLFLASRFEEGAEGFHEIFIRSLNRMLTGLQASGAKQLDPLQLRGDQ